MGSWIDQYQCARQLGLSTATIRNWIRAGYLIVDGEGRVSQSSIDRVEREVIGHDKLTSRSNKLYKTGCESVELDISNWESYESQLPESKRNRDGIYYTPQVIVDDMLSTIDLQSVDLHSATILDPCCGSGNFLVAALKIGFLPQNIYGYDLDPNAVAITRARMEALSGCKAENILCGDFLELCGSVANQFDFIYTNPPWGKKLIGHYEHIINEAKPRRMDSSELFFRASMQMLRDGGQIGFLMQGAVFNIARYSALREYIFESHVVRFTHYGNPFKGLMTSAQAVVVTKEKGDGEAIECVDGEVRYLRTRESFIHNPYLIFNFRISPQGAELIAHLLSSNSYVTLKGAARWGLGIVTGSNSRFCISEPRRGYSPIFRGGDISTEGLARPSLYITNDLSRCQQVAPIELYRAKSKIIYKFISSRLCLFLDREQRLILNSANMLLLDDGFALSEQQLVDLLNSPFMNWLHASIFASHKILRRDLEQLPIFADYFVDGRNFDEGEYLRSIGVESDGEGGYRCL